MGENSQIVTEWTARKVKPVVIFYVAAVFVGFIVIAHFVLHSSAAVKALLLTSVGAIVPLVPVVLSRLEFRLSERRLERRTVQDKNQKDFETVFRLDELSNIVPNRNGFKFYKPIEEAGPLQRFWKLHLSDRFSGEIQVESADRERVLGALSDLGIPSRT